MNHNGLRIPEKIILYNGVKHGHFDVREIVNYVATWFKQNQVIVRKDILNYSLSRTRSKTKDIAKRMSQAKIRNPNSQNNDTEPLFAEVEFEKKWLANQPEKPLGILYDAMKLQKLHFDMLPPKERRLNYLHIVIINQLIGTWDQANHHYHARVSLYGFPNIISLPGLVEAPAKPREFYVKRQLGMDPEELKQEFNDRFIDHDDTRMTELVKGYVMQALFYHMTGDPFCTDRSCRLFNAHWQEELIRAQSGNGVGFCSVHQKVLSITK